MIAQYLTHYFSYLFSAAGLRWDSDNAGEIKELEAEIIRLARANDTKIFELEQQVKYLLAKVDESYEWEAK
jgi:hypothetical protein